MARVVLAVPLFVALGCGDDDAGQVVCEAPLDGTCEHDGDCAEGALCSAARAVDGEPLSLACAASGERFSPGQPCDRSDQCAHGLCAAAGLCVRPCTLDSHCGDDERCASSVARTSDTTSHQVRACVRATSASGSVSFADQQGGASGLLLRGTEGLYVMLPRCDVVGERVERLVEQGGETLYDRAERIRANPVTTLGPPTSIYLPSGSRAVTADAHEVFFATGAVPHRVFRFGAPAGQTLDVDLFYIGLRDVPLEDPAIVNAMSTVALVLDTVGITLGDIRHHLVVGEAERRYRILDRELGELREFKEMARLSSATLTPSISIYLVRSIDGAIGATLGIPGPLGVDGTPGSGVAIGAQLILDSSGTDLGRVIAHELGHSLGLFHTSEVDGTVLEAFEDTPECTSAADMGGDGVLSATDCEGLGAENLMFWSAGATASELSAEQGALLRRAPILQE